MVTATGLEPAIYSVTGYRVNSSALRRDLNGVPSRIRTETTTGLSRFPLPVGVKEHIWVAIYISRATTPTP